MKFKRLRMKRRFISGKIVVGIDSSKRSHTAWVLDAKGFPMGKGFAIPNTCHGFDVLLWQKLRQRVEEINPEQVIFAIETACNLWLCLAHYLNEKGYSVVLVSPLTIKRSRPFISHEFSRTDPKDAFLVASAAQNGYFDFYHIYTEEVKAMHQHAITYAKLRRDYVRERNRLRAFLDQVFPEFPAIVPPRTLSAQYLLSKYFLPKHFLTLDVATETRELERISQRQHGKETLQKLRAAARHSIAVPKTGAEEIAARLTLDSWLALIGVLEKQMAAIIEELIRLASQTPHLEILTSLPGISKTTAALFIAECRDLSFFRHYKQIEKLAGYNLRVSDSGDTHGNRYMSHIGNRRLSTLLYKMTEEAAKYLPEVRLKFLRRQLKRKQYRKNLIASAPVLLRLIMALVKENRCYEIRPENVKQLEKFEADYERAYPKACKALAAAA